MKQYPVRRLIADKFNPLEKTNLELTGGSRPRLVLQYKRTKKCVFIKSYSHNPHEIYSEYLASKLAKRCRIPVQSAVFKIMPPYVVQWLKDEAGDIFKADWLPIAIEVVNLFPDHIQVVYGKDILGNSDEKTTLNYVESCLIERYGDCEDLIQSYINMVVFDAFIGNMDRHHENWGICITEKFRKAALQTSLFDGMDFCGERYFTPLFDHGSSLMFELQEFKLQQMLDDKDRIVHYANSKYGFIFTSDGKKGNIFDILGNYSKTSDKCKNRITNAANRIIENNFIDFQNIIIKMPINNSYGWTENIKDVIARCLQIRYNFIQQLS
jgi:hypothetical protein